MLQRRYLLTGALLAAAQPVAAFGQAQNTKTMAGMAMSMNDCIEHCLDSHRLCLETSTYAVKRGGALETAEMIAMLNDCAELCQATANSMLRESPLHQVLCRACAEACERCAQACSAHGSDAQMARCAQACRTCAEGCRQMSR